MEGGTGNKETRILFKLTSGINDPRSEGGGEGDWCIALDSRSVKKCNKITRFKRFAYTFNDVTATYAVEPSAMFFCSRLTCFHHLC